jgi:hypothetical protein
VAAVVAAASSKRYFSLRISALPKHIRWVLALLAVLPEQAQAEATARQAAIAPSAAQPSQSTLLTAVVVGRAVQMLQRRLGAAVLDWVVPVAMRRHQP